MAQLTDRNGAQVHEFALQAANLGLSRLADLLVAMHESGAWRKFKDGTGEYRFLPGEFDYFLSLQGLTREQVIYGVRDVEVKAALEASMDERRTGEPEYRRPLAEVRAETPTRPGRDIEPFGYTPAQRKDLGDDPPAPQRREALGSTVRRWTRSGGKPPPRPAPPITEQVKRALRRASDEELAEIQSLLAEVLQSRKKA